MDNSGIPRRQMISVFVGRVPLDMTQAQMIDLFKGCGDICEVYISPRHNEFMNFTYAFVRFRDLHSAQMAVDDLNGWPVHGSRLRVEFSEQEQHYQSKTDVPLQEQRRRNLKKTLPDRKVWGTASAEDLQNVDKLREFLRSYNEDPKAYSDYIPKVKSSEGGDGRDSLAKPINIRSLVAEVDSLEDALLPPVMDGGPHLDIDFKHLDELAKNLSPRPDSEAQDT